MKYKVVGVIVVDGKDELKLGFVRHVEAGSAPLAKIGALGMLKETFANHTILAVEGTWHAWAEV